MDIEGNKLIFSEREQQLAGVPEQTDIVFARSILSSMRDTCRSFEEQARLARMDPHRRGTAGDYVGMTAELAPAVNKLAGIVMDQEFFGGDEPIE